MELYMTQTASAIYENGVLRPTSLLFDLREGQQVQITVQVLEELTAEETARRWAELLRLMEADGALAHFPRPSEPPLADWQPLTIEGEPLSETILKMRGEK
jgi:predicted DNA-binding antitoxin AbrB/MazE fold protein